MRNPIGTLAVSDSGFVFDPRTGNTFAVNASGLVVLRGLKDGLSPAQIQDHLSATFQQVPEVYDHLRQFAQLLVELGILPASEAL